MPVKRDILAILPDKERIELMRRSVMAVMGPKLGEEMWKQMEPALTDRRRQPGDAEKPEDNFWKGSWRIYEAE